MKKKKKKWKMNRNGCLYKFTNKRAGQRRSINQRQSTKEQRMHTRHVTSYAVQHRPSNKRLPLLVSKAGGTIGENEAVASIQGASV